MYKGKPTYQVEDAGFDTRSTVYVELNFPHARFYAAPDSNAICPLPRVSGRGGTAESSLRNRERNNYQDSDFTHEELTVNQ